MTDLEKAIQTARQAITSTPSDHPELADRLNNLGVNLSRRYGRTGETKDLEEAIQITRQALTIIPSNHPGLATLLNNLGSMLESRYRRTGEIKDLEEAIQTARQAVTSTPLNHRTLERQLNNLGVNLMSRYERTGETKDLEEALQTARQAITLTSSDHPNLLYQLNNLAGILQKRYERTGKIKDLEEAIQMVRQVITLAPPNHLGLPHWLHNLGIVLQKRYKRIGETRDLEEAIQIARQAITSTPSDHPELATQLNNLGLSLKCRYEQTSEMRDLEEAIQIVRQAITSTPSDHPELARWLMNLAAMLRSRHGRTGETKDLEEAIQVSRQAVASVPSDHPNLVYQLNDLAINLGYRYERTGEISDIEEAIQIARQVITLAPPIHINLAAWLNNLASMLEGRHRQTGETKDLEEAIQVSRQAVASVPSDHPGLPRWLNNLGINLWRRYERIGELRDLEEAIDHFRNAWSSLTATPFDRIRPAIHCLWLLATQQRQGEGIDLGIALVDLLPTVLTPFLDRNDRQYVMSTFSGVASNLCGLLIASNRVYEALEYLERGRAVIISQVLNARSDLSRLHGVSEALALQYKELIEEINTPLKYVPHDPSQSPAADRRREAVDELDACIQHIRALPGHDRFLLGPRLAEMQGCAAHGCIIIINVTSFRSDAILVLKDSLQAIALPHMLSTDTKDWLRKDWEVRKKSQSRERNDEFLRFLTWLWEVCVCPVVDELHRHQFPGQDRPRVWWIGSGLASSLPFHAAGHHTKGSTENAYSKIISSYTPSIRALVHSQSRHQTLNDVSMLSGSLLVATMSNTPAGPKGKKPRDLPGVLHEKNEILLAAEDLISTTELNQPSAQKVLAELEKCSIAHFACHGTSDRRDPSRSGLILQKISNSAVTARDLEQDWLTVYKISQLQLKNAQIAYLSACSTAENRAARLADEVVHVVSGFQVAGFPHVVGCLWPAGDRVCVEVASRFYASFLRTKHPGFEGHPAAALQEAVMAVRASEPNMPLNWAQFVHYGA